MLDLRTIDDVDVAAKTVLLRSDLNVPITAGEVGDDFRLQAAVPTIRRLREAGARVVLASHLGRPSGSDPAFSLAPVGRALAHIGGFEVVTAEDVAGASAQRLVASQGEEVVLLENTRFEDGESRNDAALADRLAALADVFVMDAFGSAHRSHASTVGVAERLPAAAGLLLADEVAAFRALLEEPARPFVVVLGGAKVSSKIGVIERLVERVDSLLIGGAMCFTLFAAEGKPVGGAAVETDMIDRLRPVIEAHRERIVLPEDVVAADAFEADSPHEVVEVTALTDDRLGLDIGPEAAARFAEHVTEAATVFWNGPVGVAEWPAFASGTRTIAEALRQGRAFSVVGGGDTVAVLRTMGLEDAAGHLSTGGGAGLELIESGMLPGLEPLLALDGERG